MEKEPNRTTPEDQAVYDHGFFAIMYSVASAALSAPTIHALEQGTEISKPLVGIGAAATLAVATLAGSEWHQFTLARDYRREVKARQEIKG